MARSDVTSVDNVLTTGTGSNGLLAQSVGGGGGNGGFSLAGSLTATDGKAVSISAAVGGFGGAGSNGSTVTVDSTGMVETRGDQANGVFAQSLGGGGGNGGFAVAATVGLADGSGQISAAVGGFAGNGGQGGNVVLDRSGATSTAGEKASGLLAQSVGGGGGNGGLAISGAFGGFDAKNFTGTVGGLGGDGATAGSVTVTGAGGITTQGGESHGILAQSIGGGGGTGGFAASAILGLGGAQTNFNLGVTVGGFGGDGSAAGTVSVTNDGLIQTTGNEATGIFAQSIGGGGGAGGGSFSGIVGLYGGSEGKTINANIVVGGFGGSGNVAGDVSVVQAGGIVTTGDGAHGIRAQSIGGGGGAGGQANSLSLILGQACTLPGVCTTPDAAKSNMSGQISVGGFGGSGNDAGTVSVTSDDLIQTSGVSAHGILAQSIGGGGGTGGNGIIGTEDLFPNPLPVTPETLLIPIGHVGILKNLRIAVGGSGGEAGNGDEVTVVNDGQIVVSGDTAWGIYAQSIGGGGGSAGNAVAGLTGTVGIGGGAFGGASSGDGGDVTVTNGAAASISISGTVSAGGIFAQSIGGGGGQGGAGSGLIDIGGQGGSAGSGGSVEVTNAGSIETGGVFSDGILAQSVGGGGGTGGGGGLSLLAVGGSGGSSGNGGGVEVTNTGAVATSGVESNAVTAQSIGGGGGKGGGLVDPDGSIWSQAKEANLLTVGGAGGSAGTGGDVVVNNGGTLSTQGELSHALFAQSVGGGGGTGGAGLGLVSIGGSAGSSGDGGSVTVTNSAGGSVYTEGDGSVGIFAQSIGGGGGVGGKTIGLVAIGRSGSGGGNGGAVDIENVASVRTVGDNASAIFAQSVGGGGGAAAGATGLVPIGGDAGAGGDGGAVTVNSTGSIQTEGANSHGIFAQSVGGGGGVVNDLSGPVSFLRFAGSAGDPGTAGDVAVSHDGDITASGANSFAILAQSEGGSGNGDIIIDVLGGTLNGGTADGAAVGFLDGRDNRLTNRGTLTSVPGLEGYAITGEGGNETVSNFGTVIGNLDLGAGSNGFDNEAGASLRSGAIVMLGEGNLLQNKGVLSPGGDGVVQTTGVTGNLVQTDSGVYRLDLDFAGDLSDRVVITGEADLDGEMDVNTLDVASIVPGTRQVTILTAAGGVTDSGLSLSVAESAVAGYQLMYPNPTDVTLGLSVDFAPDGMNRNETAIGQYFNRVQYAGSSPALAPIVSALFEIPTVGELANAYDHLSPEAYSTMEVATVLSDVRFGNALFSCRVRDGEFRFAREGECIWFDVYALRLDSDVTHENFGYEQKAVSATAGMQKAIADDWRLGLAISYEHSEIDIEDLAEIEGGSIRAGVTLKRLFGGTTVGGALTGGAGSYDATRYVDFPTRGIRADGDQDLRFIGAQLRVAHDFEWGDWYLRPMIDAGVTYFEFDGFEESGAGAANLLVEGRSETYVSLRPALEIGGEVVTGDGTLVRPRAKLGVTQFLSGTDPEIAARLEGAPAGVRPFVVKQDFDETYLDVEVGVDVLTKGGATFRASYIGQFSDHTDSHGVMLKVSVPF